ncbi:MAG: gliding motility-associated C-terminal domain-containing protein [Chitinophagaceae bacterium]|nr:gliding motility-associated C-terminal domain-containing protein [Chitinophagaceae bacterium]
MNPRFFRQIEYSSLFKFRLFRFLGRRAWFLILVFLLGLFNISRVSAQIITTVAGNGNYGYSGDGGPALSAELADLYYCYPAFDSKGNMYFSQSANNTIRKVDASGIITTIAGTEGVIGYTGDGGPAVNALLYHPTGIAVDKNDNIYFADRNGSIIRMIDPSGIITTVSGPFSNSCGTGDGGLLSGAGFSAISAIVFDNNDNLYISDYGCNVVRKVDHSTGIISTIAGNGTLGFSGDGGPATMAQLAYPTKVAVDNAGNVYIPDAQNHRIRRVDAAGIITTVTGTGVNGHLGDGGQAINAAISLPGSVVIDAAGNMYIGEADFFIRKIDPSGIISTYAGNGTYGYSGDGGPAINAAIGLTEGRISIYNDDIYFANYLQGGFGNTIRKISNCESVVITQQPVDVTLCNSGDATFSISALNATGFRWQVNDGTGWVDIFDNAIYSGTGTDVLQITGATVSMDQYQYRCLASNKCGPVSTAAGILSVTSPLSPDITITASSTDICKGTPVTFTAVAQNGGSSPVYEWTKNGVVVGGNSAVYVDNSLLNGDVIVCTLTSSEACVISVKAVSNPITIQVTDPVTPGISITASDNNICSGTAVTFTATITNGGSSPSFEWFKNSVRVGGNASTYTDNALQDGDVISCVLTSSESCVTQKTATSAPITMVVRAPVAPSVTISASATSICKETEVTFTATVLNGGNSPIFQWFKNGTTVGTNSDTYVDGAFSDGDRVECRIISNAVCISVIQAVSNIITIKVNPDPVVTLNPDPSICDGAERILDAGNFVSYLWNTGATTRTITVKGTGVYSVVVTDINGCKGGDTVKINRILRSPSRFLPGDTAICSYGELTISPDAPFRSYKWSTGDFSPAITITEPGLYWLEVKDGNGCIGSDSIIVRKKDCMQGFFMPNAFTPNRDGRNDKIRPLLFGKVISYRFSIYNRWGEKVFTTTDLSQGWDGVYKYKDQDNGVFVWVCYYQVEGEEPQMKKGTLTLLR